MVFLQGASINIEASQSQISCRCPLLGPIYKIVGIEILVTESWITRHVKPGIYRVNDHSISHNIQNLEIITVQKLLVLQLQELVQRRRIIFVHVNLGLDGPQFYGGAGDVLIDDCVRMAPVIVLCCVLTPFYFESHIICV